MAFEVGNIICPKCQKKQSRYISESDLTLYLIFSELFYLVMCSLTVLAYIISNQSRWTIVILVPFLIIYLYSLKLISRKIYTNGFFKKDFMDYDFNNDQKAIKKAINFRTVVFYFFSTTLLSIGGMEKYSILFIVLSLLEVCLRYYNVLKQEKAKARFK